MKFLRIHKIGIHDGIALTYLSVYISNSSLKSESHRGVRHYLGSHASSSSNSRDIIAPLQFLSAVSTSIKVSDAYTF